MATLLPLDPDQLLSTTRSVRKRLDLVTPVDLAVIRECIDVATQAPTGGNNQGWHWLIVTDKEKMRPIAEWYRDAFKAFYGNRDAVLGNLDQADGAYEDTTRKVIDSADYQADHLGEVPVWVIACIEGRTDGAPAVWQASQWGSLLPAVWSFMLAARERGLGTAWTTLHMPNGGEQKAADLLGIPFDKYSQAGLFPIAYTIGTDFKPAKRLPLDPIVHWDTW